MTAAVLCVNITLASAQNEYEGRLNVNFMSTIAISLDKETMQNEEMYNKINATSPSNLQNVLYVTKTADNTTLIGWQGFNPNNWFPHIDGRFFSYDEVKNKENAVYISSDEYGALFSSGDDGEEIKIDGETYNIVGAGVLTPYNFMHPISDNSPQQIFVSAVSTDYSFRIIPYTTFFQKYSPELILVQYGGLSLAQLTEKAEMLKNCFENATVTLPRENSNNYLLIQKFVRGSIGIILSLLIYISVIGIMQEWLKINSKRYYVFVLCGATQRKIVFLILLEWFTYVTVAVFAAVGIQYCLLPFLTILKAGAMPTALEFFGQLIGFFLVIVLFSLKKITKVADVKNRGGAI